MSRDNLSHVHSVAAMIIRRTCIKKHVLNKCRLEIDYLKEDVNKLLIFFFVAIYSPMKKALKSGSILSRRIVPE